MQKLISKIATPGWRSVGATDQDEPQFGQGGLGVDEHVPGGGGEKLAFHILSG
jgi:hypothetical protein